MCDSCADGPQAASIVRPRPTACAHCRHCSLGGVASVFPGRRDQAGYPHTAPHALPILPLCWYDMTRMCLSWTSFSCDATWASAVTQYPRCPQTKHPPGLHTVAPPCTGSPPPPPSRGDSTHPPAQPAIGEPRRSSKHGRTDHRTDLPADPPLLLRLPLINTTRSATHTNPHRPSLPAPDHGSPQPIVGPTWQRWLRPLQRAQASPLPYRPGQPGHVP